MPLHQDAAARAAEGDRPAQGRPGAAVHRRAHRRADPLPVHEPRQAAVALLPVRHPDPAGLQDRSAWSSRAARRRPSAGTISAHRFRHTVGTQLAERGAKLHTIMKVLGHSSVSMALVYAQISDQRGPARLQGRARPRRRRSPAQPRSSSEAGVLPDAAIDWLKTNFFKTELELGHCLRLPAEGPCECDLYLTCAKFVTTREYAPRLRARLRGRAAARPRRRRPRLGPRGRTAHRHRRPPHAACSPTSARAPTTTPPRQDHDRARLPTERADRRLRRPHPAERMARRRRRPAGLGAAGRPRACPRPRPPSAGRATCGTCRWSATSRPAPSSPATWSSSRTTTETRS